MPKGAEDYLQVSCPESGTGTIPSPFGIRHLPALIMRLRPEGTDGRVRSNSHTLPTHSHTESYNSQGQAVPTQTTSSHDTKIYNNHGAQAHDTTSMPPPPPDHSPTALGPLATPRQAAEAEAARCYLGKGRGWGWDGRRGM